MRNTIEIMQSQIKEMNKILNQIVHPMSVPSNINFINNGIINIVFAIGKEKTDYISDEFMEKCVKRLAKGVVDYIRAKHFNRDYPCNMNIRIENKKAFSDGFLLVFSPPGMPDMWANIHKVEFTNEFLRKNWCILDDFYSENEDRICMKFDKATKKKVDEWYDIMRDPDSTFDKGTQGAFLALCRNTLTIPTLKITEE